MSTSSFEEDSRTAGRHATSSGLESTGSLLSSLLSDSSDVQTEITPPTSPASYEGKTHTPRDILDASRRLGQVSLALQNESDLTPTKHPKRSHHRGRSHFIANDEAGYDADGDGDGDGDGDKDEGARPDAGAIPAAIPIRRPMFLRIDTRQHRRAASMLATRRLKSPGPGFGDADIPRPRRPRLPSISLKLNATTSPSANAMSYELRRRTKVEPVGLGIGLPENHPLRSRAFSMPVPRSASPISDGELEKGVVVQGEKQARKFGWLPSDQQTKSKKKATQVNVHTPYPVRLALQPTFLEVSPSPIEGLPAPGGAMTLRSDDVHDRTELKQERIVR